MYILIANVNNLSRLEHILRNRISEERVSNILKEAAEKISIDIQNLAPIDTGTYRNSIKVGEVKKQNTKYTIDIYSDLASGWKNVALGYLLEFGTGIKGETTNTYDHGYPYRQTPWVYYNERYGRWIFTYGNIARPHFYPGLHLNENYFKDKIKKEISK